MTRIKNLADCGNNQQGTEYTDVISASNIIMMSHLSFSYQYVWRKICYMVLMNTRSSK